MLNRVAFLFTDLLKKKRVVEPDQTGKPGQFRVRAAETYARYSEHRLRHHWIGFRCQPLPPHSIITTVRDA